MIFRPMPLPLTMFLLTLPLGRIAASQAAQSPVPSQAQHAPYAGKDAEIRSSLDRITAALDAVSSNTAEPVELQKLIYDGAIPGALSRLDPFSVFLDEDQFLSMRQQQRGVRQGFGAVLNVQAGKITVLQSVPDSPFARAGLGPGDRIVSVNGKRIATMSLEEMVDTLQAARAKKVKLEVLQSGAVVARDFELDPAEVASPTVDKKFLLPSGIAYLHIDRIEDGTAGEIARALEQLKAGQQAESLTALVMDLRDNPGGSVNGALATVGLFVPKDSVVVSLKGNNVPETRYLTKGGDEPGPAYADLPLILLINKQSASAAEIIPAALQEHDRAWLVGETTFGKGVAETVMPLSSGTALILTTARYYTPRGRSVQKALPATSLAGILTEGQQGFTSYSGRPLKSGEGLRPDEVVPRQRRTRLMEALEQSTAFINFAQEVLQRRGRIARDFRATDDIVQQFQAFLRNAGFRAPEQEWDKALPWIRRQIEGEALTLVYGMEAGEQVEILDDPQVQAATAAVSAARALITKTKP